MAELLRLYLTYNCLEEAAQLVIEYVSAVLGNGKEYFGLQVSPRLTSRVISALLIVLLKTVAIDFFIQLVQSWCDVIFQTSLHYSAPPVSLPYTSIDQLMWTLRDTKSPQLSQVSDNTHSLHRIEFPLQRTAKVLLFCLQLHIKLDETLEKYFETLQQVSQDKIDAETSMRSRLTRNA